MKNNIMYIVLTGLFFWAGSLSGFSQTEIGGEGSLPLRSHHDGGTGMELPKYSPNQYDPFASGIPNSGANGMSSSDVGILADGNNRPGEEEEGLDEFPPVGDGGLVLLFCASGYFLFNVMKRKRNRV